MNRIEQVLLLGGCVWATGTAHAQDPNEQLWIDLVVGKVWQEYTFTTELSPRWLLSGDEAHWTNWNLAPTIERSMTPHWDLILGLPLAYTVQTDDVTTFETTIQAGTRFLFTPFKRVQLNLTTRYEYRFLNTLEPEPAKDQSPRLRFRGETVIPLDTRNYHSDTMWYALADCEVFVNLDEGLNERFANRTRSRIGLGRKFTYNWRAEIIYTYQSSRRTIEDDERTADNIFRFRLKYYFSRPDQKRQPSDVGF